MGKTNTRAQVTGHETLHEFRDSLTETVKHDAKASWETMWEQFGLNLRSSSDTKPEQKTAQKADKGPVQLVDFTQLNKSKPSPRSIEQQNKPQKKENRAAAIDYAGEILKVGEKAERRNERETMNTIQQLLKELRRLAESSKILQMEFASVSVEQTPTKAGEYHVGFFEWMLIVIRAAREKVENSGAWLAAVKGKGGKKRWNNKDRKKWFANTSLSLGNESGGGVINQTG